LREREKVGMSEAAMPESAGRLLVTGRHGFVGNVLASVASAGFGGRRWEIAAIDPALDLRDVAATHRLVNEARPAAVLHLAAQSAVPDAFRDPAMTIEVNLLGTLNLLQALRATGFTGRLVYAGTGDVYGLVPEDELPVAETRLPRPRNPYAVSKLAAEALCWQWHVTEGLDVVLARPFNHIGWGQSDRFAIAGFARQIAEIAAGLRAPRIVAGDLAVTRDFTDVNDVARAYLRLLVDGVAGETYNVCSGVEYGIADLLARMLRLEGIDVPVVQDSARLRQAEQRRMRGDPSKIIAATGWHPETPIDVSLRAALDYWKERIADG
jgi:GDP-4-dehydro-6-deoxy-D-mannose reductase